MVVRKKVSKKKTAGGKSAAAKKSLIGVDPLAFMAADEMEASQSAHEGKADFAEPEKGANTDDNVMTKIGAVEQMTEELKEPKGQELKDEQGFTASCVIDLGVNLSIREAESLYKQLDELSAEQYVLDASEVNKVDTCGLQLLTLFIQHLEKEGKSVTWLSPDENLCQAAGLLGLSEQLRLP